MENFLTILPRFLASDVGAGSGGADTLEPAETFEELERALKRVREARSALEQDKGTISFAGSAGTPFYTYIVKGPVSQDLFLLVFSPPSRKWYR